jgi:SSS family solute:Na+ symporter
MAAVGAWVLLHGDLQPEVAAAAQQQLDTLNDAGDEQLAKQLTTTIAMKELLPVGVLGLLASVMIMAAISTDSTYLHSWGSIFVQDVLGPIRQARGKSKLTTQQHLKYLKRGVLGVAIFAWCFSMVFPVQEYIFMYFQATGAIFTGGAGAVLIGGLYWRRGTTGAAWASMIVGSTLAVLGVLTINIFWPWLVPFAQGRFPAIAWVQTLPGDFWMNGLEWGFSVSVIALLTYVGVSLASPHKAVDFDKLFYRGEYAVEPKEGEPDYVPKVEGKAVPGWARKLGVTEEFTTGDKWIFGLKYGLFIWGFGGFLTMSLVYAFGGMRSEDSWIIWWTIRVSVAGLLGTAATVWFLIGGFKDLFAMLHRLKTLQRDESDDGTVTQHLGEPEADDKAPRPEPAP